MIALTSQSIEYLLRQKGELEQHMANDGPDYWVQAYEAQLNETLAQLERARSNPLRVLDIGSGLGGIDLRLMQTSDCYCVLVDGENAGPHMEQHNIPFCSRAAVVQFMADNGIGERRYAYYNPSELPDEGPFDLVISLRSWCFHYGPEVYLDYVKRNTVPGAVLVLDVRKGSDWRACLRSHFFEIEVLERSDKYERAHFLRLV
jgi:SAM-dependent methyltransferase